METFETLLVFAEPLLFVIMLAVGYFAGRFAEKQHYASIRKRERYFERVLVFTNRFPPSVSRPCRASLVAGSVVVSQDYFKAVAAALYSIFGGRVRSYESLLDRARRESVLRMKHAALRKGATMIVNVKLQTVQVPALGVGAVEVLAYGTALRAEDGAEAPHGADGATVSRAAARPGHDAIAVR